MTKSYYTTGGMKKAKAGMMMEGARCYYGSYKHDEIWWRMWMRSKRCLSILIILELYKEDNLEMEVHYDEQERHERV